MNKDIRLSVGFWQHHKTKKMIKKLGLEGARSLQILWSWAAQNRTNGKLSGMSWEDIEMAADWGGNDGDFFKFCLSSSDNKSWIDEIDGEYFLHDWAENNPWVAETEDRSDAARMSQVAKHFPKEYNEFVKNGVKKISRSEYERLRSNNDRSTTDEQPNIGTLTPSPIPSLKKEEPPISPTGEVRAKTRRQKTSAPENYTPEFEQLWLVSPARNGMKKGKRVAFEKFWHLTQISRLVTAEYLCERMKKLAPQYGAYARDLVTWLNQCGWEDQAHLPMAAAPYDWRKDCATN